MARVTLSGLSKTFGQTAAVRDVSLEIEEGEFVVFVGPSGCGKSTLLRMIAGLEDITAGELRIGDKAMNAVHAADRGIAMVFQSYALYPHMSVRQNIGFGIRMAGMGRREVAEKVAEAAAILQIEELLDRRPRSLSGGQRQRVAIGRAIVKSPGVFLFDEPLSNLDADLRAQMRVEIARLHQTLGSTMIYVTHDQVEAMTLADRIVVLNGGTIEQEGPPEEIYDRPANLFVAGFVGQPKINLMPGTLGAGAVDLPGFGRVPLPGGATDLPEGMPVTVGLRPEATHIGEGGATAAECRVELVETLGNEVLVHLRLPGTDDLLTATVPRARAPRVGETVRLGVDAEAMHLFGPDGRRMG